MTKSVCIVGAGPSGLVAAKALLHDVAPGTFSVTIYDAQPRIGGLWPLRKDDGDGLMHPMMIANQSRHTVQFSDLSWDESVPHLPRAWQVGQYLDKYTSRYLADATIHLGQKVVATTLQDGGSWHVETQSEKGPQTRVFDHLLVSTGYFGQPVWPKDIPLKGDVPIVHSSKYRDLKTLLGRNQQSGGKILVVGAQMSGIEISGTIATHLSSAVNSPGQSEIQSPEKYSIHHVAHRPAWVFPTFTSPKPDKAAAPFMPCDLPAYNLAVRPQPLTNGQGHMSIDAARIFNSIYKSVIGSNQSDVSDKTKIDGDLLDEQPWLAMSTHYMDFVRSGLITIHQGKLASVTGTSASLDNGAEQVEDIAAVVLATGFDPAPSVSFLPPSVLETLAHSEAHPNLALALAFHDTHHPSLPSLGFVGFYRSPYWGVMEMQARLIAQLWSTKAEDRSSQLKESLQGDDGINHVLTLRSDSRVSQFPMGDYPFIMQEFAKALEIPIMPPAGQTPVLGNGKSMDTLTPARYVSPRSSEEQKSEARKNREATYTTEVAALTTPKFVAGAVFRSLLGEWKLERNINSRLPSHPSGHFSGTAKFLLRDGTADGRNASPEKDLGMEYLYIEDGEFTALENGMKFRATRRYVWRYDENTDKLSVWFTRTDDSSKADYLFHEVEFQTSEDEDDKTTGWKAKASHLCIEDLYDVHYSFVFNAVNLKDWQLGYSVKGPKKDYTIEGSYRR